MTLIFTVVLICVLLWPVIIYNRLIRLRNDLKSAWSQIDVQLKRRHDLVPNLVSVVKGFMDFERETLERVVKARAGAVSAIRMREKAAAEDLLTDALDKLLLVVENYPSLKSDQSAMRLQEELVTTENRIAFSRQLYNDLVANYMTRREVFPDNIVSSVFAFPAAEYFSAEAEDRAVPATQLGPKRR
jgi:LemA protein